MDRLDGKVALITGAAKGLGEADARLFIAEGAKVILADIDRQAESLAEELGQDATFMHLDVTNEGQVSISLGVINTVTNYKFIWYLEPDPFQFNFNFPAGRFVQ